MAGRNGCWSLARRLLRARAVPAAVLLGCLAAGAPAPAAVAARLPSTRVFVTPGVGHPQTSFALRFRIPVATGTFGSVIRRDTLSVSGPRHAGCVSSVATTLRFAKRGTRMKVTLKPERRGGSWCAGQFRGQIVQRVVIRCTSGPARACPYLLVAPLTIARFRFRVAPAAAGGPAPAGGPTFAGLISATTCNSLAPQVLPRPTSYTLIWKAATDPITPSSALVYEVFLATTPGAEDYAQPTWTTAPGVTSFTTPDLPHSGPVYFVVRARDAAGNKDGNTIERQGVAQCN